MNSSSDVNALRVMIFIRYLVCCNEIMKNDVKVFRGDVKYFSVQKEQRIPFYTFGQALTRQFDNK